MPIYVIGAPIKFPKHLWYYNKLHDSSPINQSKCRSCKIHFFKF